MMRPITQVLEPEPFALFEADKVINVIGPYCSLCERPVHDRPSLWQSTQDVLVTHIADAHAASLLLLCVNCADWQQRTKGAQDELLLPDHATTFRAGGDSPYRYSLESVTLHIVDGDEVETTSEHAAIVTGTTPEAANTVERFRLNTPYYDAATKTVTAPRAEWLSGADRRLTLRTEAWRRAAEVVPRALALREAGLLDVALDGIRGVIEGTGFWSVWLTVFWAAAPERELVRTLFASERQVTHHRGTSTDFLD